MGGQTWGGVGQKIEKGDSGLPYLENHSSQRDRSIEVFVAQGPGLVLVKTPSSYVKGLILEKILFTWGSSEKMTWNFVQAGTVKRLLGRASWRKNRKMRTEEPRNTVQTASLYVDR